VKKRHYEVPVCLQAYSFRVSGKFSWYSAPSNPVSKPIPFLIVLPARVLFQAGKFYVKFDERSCGEGNPSNRIEDTTLTVSSRHRSDEENWGIGNPEKSINRCRSFLEVPKPVTGPRKKEVYRRKGNSDWEHPCPICPSTGNSTSSVWTTRRIVFPSRK
jgi:hypothetical protein